MKSDLNERERLVSLEIIEREDSLRHKQADVEDMIRRVNDRRIDLEHENENLKDQIRMIEAKARPDEIWTTAFALGFSKAWDQMWDMQISGFEKGKEKLRNQTISEVLKSLQK